MNKRVITSLHTDGSTGGTRNEGVVGRYQCNDNNNNPMTHPVNAYTNHEVKADIKDSQEDSQKLRRPKATYKQAKEDYGRSLKADRSNSQATKDAKKRMHDSHKEMGPAEIPQENSEGPIKT